MCFNLPYGVRLHLHVAPLVTCANVSTSGGWLNENELCSRRQVSALAKKIGGRAVGGGINGGP